MRILKKKKKIPNFQRAWTRPISGLWTRKGMVRRRKSGSGWKSASKMATYSHCRTWLCFIPSFRAPALYPFLLSLTSYFMFTPLFRHLRHSSCTISCTKKIGSHVAITFNTNFTQSLTYQSFTINNYFWVDN